MPGRGWLEQVALVAESGRQILARAGGAPPARDPRALCRRLVAQRGEASGLALAIELVGRLQRMDAPRTVEFLEMLRSEFAPDAARVDHAVARWRERQDQESLQALAEATESPRQELFRRINMVPSGTAALVELRRRLLAELPARPELRVVDDDLRHLFLSWFNRGFLQLEEIGWDTPAAVLERLIQYEAVHEIHGWGDLRSRLARDRRCFAFFHPSLPGEPLIFVEVALTRGLAACIRPLLDPGRAVGEADAADTAIFYSISNCQQGLRGISFGNFLIKQVTTELATQLPRLRTFATLSPVPGLAGALRREDDPDGFTEARLARLTADLEISPTDRRRFLLQLLETPGPRGRPARRALERLTLAYLSLVRREQRVADPVAHFHLSNGARLERIHVDADPTDRAGASFGVMVNYLYERSGLEANHERYVEEGRLVVAPDLKGQVKQLAAAWSSA